MANQEYTINPDGTVDIITGFNADGTVASSVIEHGALEIARICGHKYLLTDEGVKFMNEWDSVNLNKQDYVNKISNERCFDCQSRYIGEQTEILENTRLMPSNQEGN